MGYSRCRNGGLPAGLEAGRLLFWQSIAKGHSIERSAEVAGISPAMGTRWFRHGGEMPDQEGHNRALPHVSRARRDRFY